MLYKNFAVGDNRINPFYQQHRISFKLLMLFLIFCFEILPAPAQQIETEKKGYLEFLTGFNAVGPAKQMFQLMIDNNFDERVSGFFGTTTNPNYSGIPITFQVGYHYQYATKSKIGLLIRYSSLNEVQGASASGSRVYLFEKFSNLSIIPVYSYKIFNDVEVQAGPALMFNKAEETSLPSINNFNSVSAGLLAGLNIKLWDKKVSYGRLSTNYLFAIPTKMGPFVPDYNQGSSIPETILDLGI